MALHLHLMGLLIILFLVVVQCQPQIVFISPDLKTTPCPDESVPCMNLSQYASLSSSQIASEVTLRFLQGDHCLTNVLNASNLSNFTMLRAFNTSRAAITIFCLHHGHFEFHSIQNVVISDLQLDGCSGNVVASVNKFVLKNSTISRAQIKRALSVTYSDVTISDCNLTSNKGGALILMNSFGAINRCKFGNNDADFGSGIDVDTNNTVSISDSAFYNNRAAAGDIYKNTVTMNAVSIINCTSGYNNIDFGSVNAWVNDTVIVTKNSTDYNVGIRFAGGGVYVRTNNTVCITNCTFNNNSAFIDVDSDAGGSVFVYTNNNIFVTNSTFDNSSAFQGGSVFMHTNNTVVITNCTFSNNGHRTGYGGGVDVIINNTVSITNSIFHNNSANHGGGIYMQSNNTVSISNSLFDDNSAVTSGGGIALENSNNVATTNSTFDHNSADNGASVYMIKYNTMEFRDNTIMRTNRGDQSLLFIVLSSVCFSGQTTIENNSGLVFALSSNISFHGTTIFYQNSQIKNSISQGGLITARRSNVSFTGNVEIFNNTADNGGAISAVQSNVYIYDNILIEHNHARHSGGGIYAYLSQVDFSGHCTIRGNTAVREGGGIHAVGSTVSLSKGGSLLITENTANLGGGMSLELNAKLIIFTESSKNRNSLKFTHNVAQSKGGAIYVADNTLSGTCANDSSSAILRECFFQALALYSVNDNNVSIPNYDTIFSNNTANLNEGGTLYGGLLDRCKISPFVEGYSKYENATGSDYFRNVTKIEGNRSNSITSDPVRVCFCTDDKPNCTIQSSKLTVKKGHTFELSVMAVDQVERPMIISQDNNVILIHAFLSKALQGSHLKEGQTSQHEYNGSCTQLQYNVVSEQSSEELVLYADGPCKDEVGLSRLVIYIDFLECTCPDGFIPSQSNDNCSCGCDPKLTKPQHFIENCSSSDTTLLRSGTSWISYLHNCNDPLFSKYCSNSSFSAGYVVNLYCPYDYCQPADQNVHINVSMPNGSDALCAFNRSGKLCGSCEGGLSHSLGSSQCMSCTNAWLSLLIPFSLAGIALVVFVLMLNLTVASGTINGLIFYANINAANPSIFLPFDKSNVLTVFIAWLNLDLGIKTCFFNGMDAYAKIWLQFIFPAYIILLVFVIILICTLSEKFANLIGSKNPVATLATLFLLSYTKLLRLTITALNFTYLDHLNDGSKDLVWLYDANVAYFKGKHIPLFVAAIFIMVVGVFYTFLLLFWQWLQHCSKWRGLRWVNDTKLKALMDAYHAPYQPKHRYWTGLLLLVRVVLYLVSALNFSGDPTIILFSVGCVLAILLSLKMVCTQSKIYKNWGLDSLDTLCLLNMQLYAIGSLYLHTMNVELHKRRRLQVSLAYISASISFAIFLTLLAFHSYIAFFKRKRISKIFLEKLIRNKNEESHLLSDGSSLIRDDCSDEEEDTNLRKELREIVPDPPNEDEYRQLEVATQRARAMERRRAKNNKQEVTCTVVEIPRPELPLSLHRDSLNSGD